MPWNVVTNFLHVSFVASKQDQAGALLLAWTIEILKNKLITNCLVIGVKDNFFGEAPIAICETPYLAKKQKIENQIIKNLEKKLSKIQYPHRYIFLKKFKILKSGKIDKLYYKKKYKNLKIPNLTYLFKK